MPQGDAPTFVNSPLDLDAYENWPHVPAPRSLTSFALPTRMQCWWTVQDEASNTITLPLCRAHHSLGRASPTLSAGSRCPGGRAAGECQGEPSDASARAHAAARAPPGGLQGTMPRRAPGTRGATRATVPSGSFAPREPEPHRQESGGHTPGGSAQPGAGADLESRWTVDVRPREQARGHQGQEVSTETAGSSLAPGHSQQGHGGSPPSPALGLHPFHLAMLCGEGSGLPLVVHSRFPDC